LLPLPFSVPSLLLLLSSSMFLVLTPLLPIVLLFFPAFKTPIVSSDFPPSLSVFPSLVSFLPMTLSSTLSLVLPSPSYSVPFLV